MARHILASSLLLGALSLLHVGAAIGTEEAARPSLTFGVAPQQSASELARVWTPILNLLTEKTGYVLHFATAKDVSTFEQRLAAGEYDIAYMNPLTYTVFHRAPGYRVLAKEKERMLHGIVVVHKDAEISDISQLHGKTVAFTDPKAFAAAILVQAELGKREIAVIPKYVASHDSVYLAVARGLVAAGGGIPRTFDNLPPEIRKQLRILWHTAAYTPHAFAAHPRLADATATRLQVALTTIADDPRGADLLRTLGLHPLTLAVDRDYDDIRRLDIRLPDPMPAH